MVNEMYYEISDCPQLIRVVKLSMKYDKGLMAQPNSCKVIIYQFPNDVGCNYGHWITYRNNSWIEV
jgi:hypothetical protein